MITDRLMFSVSRMSSRCVGSGTIIIPTMATTANARTMSEYFVRNEFAVIAAIVDGGWPRHQTTAPWWNRAEAPRPQYIGRGGATPRGRDVSSLHFHAGRALRVPMVPASFFA